MQISSFFCQWYLDDVNIRAQPSFDLEHIGNQIGFYDIELPEFSVH